MGILALAGTVYKSLRRALRKSTGSAEFLVAADLRGKNLGVGWAFVGMFYEVDEGTAIFKVSHTPPKQGYFVAHDGHPSDWYLRPTTKGSKVLSGERPNTPTIPISP